INRCLLKRKIPGTTRHQTIAFAKGIHYNEGKLEKLCGEKYHRMSILWYFSYDQLHFTQHPFMGAGAGCYIDACGFNPAVAEYVGQMRQVLLYRIKAAGKQMPEIVREHLFLPYTGLCAQFFHVVTNVGCIQW